MTKIERFINYLNKYSIAYQAKYSLGVEAQITLELLATNDVITILYKIPGTLIEPAVIEVDQYWLDGEYIRRCDSNDPEGVFANSYTIIDDHEDEFGYSVTMLNEPIDVGPDVALPEPVQPPGKGTIDVSDGERIKKLAVGTDGYALTADSTENLGLKWIKIVTEVGEQTLVDKTLTSPVLNGLLTGTGILDEDDLVSNSNLQLATQQSIKTYVDSNNQFIYKLSIINDNGNIKCRMDDTPGYQKNNTLSSDTSASILPDQTVTVGTITYEMDATGSALMVGIDGQTNTSVLGVTILGNSTQTYLMCNCVVDSGSMVISFSDINGNVANIPSIPSLSSISILVVYSATVV